MYRVMALYRAARACYLKGVPLLPRIFTRINRIKNAACIPYTADIDPSVVFMHGGLGCVIHERAVIGANCVISQNVTIGGSGRPGERFDLVIGKNVTIGAGACILSGSPMSVGDHAHIGANAVVLTSIPANCTAVGVPARIIRRKA